MVPSHGEHGNWEPWEHRVQQKNSCSLWTPVERGKNEQQIMWLCVSLSLCGMLCKSRSSCSLWKFNTFCIYSSHRAILCFRLITIDMNFLFHFCLRCCTSDLLIQNGSAFALRLPTPVFPLHLLLSVSTQTTGTHLVYLTSQLSPDSSGYISSSVLFLSNKTRISNFLFKLEVNIPQISFSSYSNLKLYFSYLNVLSIHQN